MYCACSIKNHIVWIIHKSLFSSLPVGKTRLIPELHNYLITSARNFFSHVISFSFPVYRQPLTCAPLARVYIRMILLYVYIHSGAEDKINGHEINHALILPRAEIRKGLLFAFFSCALLISLLFRMCRIYGGTEKQRKIVRETNSANSLYIHIQRYSIHSLPYTLPFISGHDIRDSSFMRQHQTENEKRKKNIIKNKIERIEMKKK